MNDVKAHALAKRLITKRENNVPRGVPITFRRDIPVTDAQGVATGDVTTESVLVHCTDNYGGGDPEEYAKLGLTKSSAPALFGVPDVIGNEPAPGMEGMWAGKNHAVRSCLPYRPQGRCVTMVLIVQAA